MRKFCTTILFGLTMALFATTATLAQVVDYSEEPYNHVTYYHYPAPPKALQYNAPLPQTQRSVNGAAQAYQNQYQTYAESASPATNNNYQATSAVTQKFISSALDNVAFNLALVNQGYTIGNAALTATSRSSKTSTQSIAAASSAPALASESASSSLSSSTSPSSSPQITSLNVKLPLPIGITPLNIAPLPLQAGAPYTALPNGVTSYGTTYPQRKKR